MLEIASSSNNYNIVRQ